jgi:hypothetical protein
MKKFVYLVVFVGAVFLGYRWFAGWRAYKAYEGFAEAWAQEKRAIADNYGDAEAVRHAFEDKSLRGTQGGAAMEAFRGTRYSVESKTRNDGGDVELVVNQTIFFDPPGVTTGIGGAMFARYRHAATVRRTADGWRVVAFEPTFIEMKELRRRG